LEECGCGGVRADRAVEMAAGQRRRRLGSGDGGWAAATAAGQRRLWLGSGDDGWAAAATATAGQRRRQRLGSRDGGADWAAVTAVKIKGFDLNLEL